MIYTAIFQYDDGRLRSEVHNAPPDRNLAWRQIYEGRNQADACLIVLITGNHYIFTYQDLQRIEDEY